ncbi:MAG: hypothetical protein NTZ68_04065 [Candidatus Dependentiae bacterium]|nr:hypothetical protein [Candidatus Dependentiae bacterium]
MFKKYLYFLVVLNLISSRSFQAPSSLNSLNCCEIITCLQQRQNMVVDILKNFRGTIPVYCNLSKVFLELLSEQQEKIGQITLLFETIKSDYQKAHDDKKCFDQVIDQITHELENVSIKIKQLDSVRIRLDQSIQSLGEKVIEDNNAFILFKDGICNN